MLGRWPLDWARAQHSKGWEQRAPPRRTVSMKGEPTFTSSMTHFRWGLPLVAAWTTTWPR